MDSGLETLKKNRDALLLAEVGVWLHMLDKYNENFLKNPDYNYKKFRKELDKDIKTILEDDWPQKILKIMEPSVQLKNAPQFFSQFISKRANHNVGFNLLKVLADSHGRGSGTEKGVLKDAVYDEQSVEVNLATAFGYETDLIDLNQLSTRKNQFYKFLERKLTFLKSKLSSNSSNFEWSDWRSEFIKRVVNEFSTSCGDTRRPINDVTLWDQTAATVAFFKSELAEILLNGWKDPSEYKYKYRLLRISLDGMEFIGQSSRIGDILTREELIEKAFNNVKDLIEVEYPLGFEIYRDVNSILFLTPDVDVLKCKDGQKTLQQLIKERFGEIFKGEVDPKVSQTKGSRNVFFIGNAIKEPIKPLSPTASYLKKCWNNVEDKCSICQIRPQGYGKKSENYRKEAKNRKMCCICMDRLKGRSRNWIKNQNKTIWIDEVEDVNGRVALIAGKFDLEHWQNGNFISTFRNLKTNCGTTFSEILNELSLDPETKLEELAKLKNILNDEVIKNTENIKGLTDFLVENEDLGKEQFSSISCNERLALAVWRKPPSFARLRRVWETTYNFWNFIERELNKVVGTVETRLIIKGNLKLDKFPEEGYAYDFELKKGVKASFVWDGDKFISAFNLSYIAKQLDIPIESSEKEVAEMLRDFIEKQRSLNVYEDIMGSERRNKVFSITQCKVIMEECNYFPLIPILTDPEQFMVLVPADKALNVVNKIKTEYEIQFSKVRNRLPLHMNMVFFNRKQPLYASLDAAHRMFTRESNYNALWEVKAVDEADSGSICKYSKGKLTDKCKKITLKRNNEKINDTCTFFVSYGLGDPNKEDIWHPYFFAEEKAEEMPEFTERDYYFSAPFPSESDEGKYKMKDLVHVKDLEIGDKIYFTPSTLDFEFLDVTSRRYELVYKNGRRLPKVDGWVTRPFLLDDLTVINQIWNDLSKLTLSQIHQFMEVLGNWRQKWSITEEGDKTFEKFAVYALKRAFGKGWLALSKESRDRLVNATLNGHIFDILELQLKILKKKPEGDLELKLGGII